VSSENPAYPRDWNRILSLVVAAGWLGLGVTAGAVGIVAAVLFLVLPLACIWFPDTMGGLKTVLPSLAPRAIDRESSPWAVRLLGWVLLLLPLVGVLAAKALA
jgi:hypothetical protein